MDSPWLRHEINYELPRIILLALANSHRALNPAPVRERDRAMSRIEPYLAEPTEEVLTVADLCSIAGVTDRTLRHAFRERFGITPKGYLQALRLNQVRGELRRSGHISVKICDVANKWGFWHSSPPTTDDSSGNCPRIL